MDSPARGKAAAFRSKHGLAYEYTILDGNGTRVKVYSDQRKPLSRRAVGVGDVGGERGVGATNLRAWERDGSARDFIAADVEYVNPSYAVEPGTRRGRKSPASVRDTYKDFKTRSSA